MEAALHADVFATTGGELGEHQGCLDGTGTARRAQVHAAFARQPRRQDGQQIFDESLPGRGVEVQGLPRFSRFESLDHRLADNGVVPAQRHRPGRCQTVDVPAAVGVTQPGTGCLDRPDRQPPGVGRRR
ncbi:hypothetical protein A5742_04140 [Mycolicibacterium fortuitum]|uniref:Uncharacterized protein n=1 Tax=Mycolicibacterium fortuitum TaxID=1766 RepID=A0ABD6QIT4_MYCFO|nr:hypothetical protein A5742_04140 [Mycolicibacterium fortuitum]